jgi:UDP-N-acetyl-2-amino-2-deoxyglucuronate dehydrogenase
VSICSPNYLHDAHIRFALRVGADAICEKPIVINPWNLDALQELELESGQRVYTVLQLRYSPAIAALKQSLPSSGRSKHDVCVTYVTARGGWYDVSWKGSEERSGGIVTNIGIHLLDLLVWLFGRTVHVEVHLRERRRASGFIELERARVQWLLSTDPHDLPFAPVPGSMTTLRSITVDGTSVEVGDASHDLHVRAYEDVLRGRGCGIEESRPAIVLAHTIRQATPAAVPDRLHPMVAARAV